MIKVKVEAEPVTTQSRIVSAPEKSFSGVPMEALLTDPLTAAAKGVEALKELKESKGLKESLLSSVPIPTFQMDDVSVDFTMEVKESNNNGK